MKLFQFHWRSDERRERSIIGSDSSLIKYIFFRHSRASSHCSTRERNVRELWDPRWGREREWKNWKIKQILMKFMINEIWKFVKWPLMTQQQQSGWREFREFSLDDDSKICIHFNSLNFNGMIFFIQLVCILFWLSCVISKEIQIKIKIIWKWSFRYYIYFFISISFSFVLLHPRIIKISFLLITAAVSLLLLWRADRASCVCRAAERVDDDASDQSEDFWRFRMLRFSLEWVEFESKKLFFILK